jgi:hypothetical protein
MLNALVGEEKVFVEAEKAPGGVVLSLRDVRLRRKLAQSAGRHNATLDITELRALGFPEQFFSDLERGRPVQFKMNYSAFADLVGGSGRLDGLGAGFIKRGGGMFFPSSSASRRSAASRDREPAGEEAGPRRVIRRGSNGGGGSYGRHRVIPVDLCIYRAGRKVAGLHRGRILEDDYGEMCARSKEESEDPAAAAVVMARVAEGGTYRPGRNMIFQPIKQIHGDVWLGRSTGAGFDGLDGLGQEDWACEVCEGEVLPHGDARRGIQRGRCLQCGRTQSVDVTAAPATDPPVYSHDPFAPEDLDGLGQGDPPAEVQQVVAAMIANAKSGGFDEDRVYWGEEDGRWSVGDNYEQHSLWLVYTDGVWSYHDRFRDPEEWPMPGGFREAMGNAQIFFTG